MAQPHVFLSHSSKDIAFTRRLEGDLRGAGATVYRVSADEGGDFQRRIDEALVAVACEWVVLVLTTDALASTWVQQEIYAANRLRHDGRIKEILPLQAGAVDYRAIPPLWGVYNIFDASRDYGAGRDGLLRALGLLQSTPDLVSASQPPVGARPAAPAATPDTSVLPQRLASLGFAGYRSGAAQYIVPPVVSVPAGEFLMGSDPKRDRGAQGDEQPQHRVTLPGFQIARFPVTVAEYACFVRSSHAEPKSQYNQLTWKTQLEQGLDHPVVNVSWRDAVAYAAWLKQRTGQPWRLPSEAEWEKAARWDPATRTARIYPWGDSFDQNRANTSEGGKGTTTPVGSYPNGASPCGAQEMSGNVWEWTSSLFKPYPYTSSDGREALSSTDNRAMRGGSWLVGARLARAAFRGRYHPGLSSGVYGGVRLVCAVSGS